MGTTHDLDLDAMNAICREELAIDVVFDIGAHEGTWSRTMREVFRDAEFHLFEPRYQVDTDLARRLDQVVDAIGNSKIHPTCVGATTGQTRFRRLDDDGQGSTTLCYETDNEEIMSLPVISLGEAISQGDLPPPDVVKMDIQGGELAALEGIQTFLPDVKILILEAWLVRLYGPKTPLLHELISFLMPFGFYPVGLSEIYRTADRVMASADTIFINKHHVTLKGQEDYWLNSVVERS